VKFSRSLVGYAPAQVDEELYQKLSKFSIEKKAVMEQFHEAVREHDQLISQRDALRSNLEYVRVSSTFVGNYEKHLSPAMLSKVQDTTHAKVQRIIEEKASQVSLIEETIALLDNQIAIVKEELCAIARSVEVAALSVNLHDTLQAQIETVDTAIRGYFDGNAKREVNGTLDVDIAAGVLPMLMSAPALRSMKSVEGPAPSAAPNNANGELDPASRAAAESYLAKLRGDSSPQLHLSSVPSVVVAENDRDTALLLCHILEREGYEVSMVADGYALSNMVKELPPPAVLVLNRLIHYIEVTQLIKEIRSSSTWCDVPILVLTPEHDKQSTINVLDAGANDSLEKPFNPRELAARVKRLSR